MAERDTNEEKARRCFYLDVDRSPLPRLVTDRFPVGLRAIADAFTANLASTSTTTSVPYTLYHFSVLRRRFDALRMAARIRLMKDEKENVRESANDAKAASTGLEQLKKEVNANRAGFIRQTFLELEEQLNDPAVLIAAHELLRQGVVLAWGALEVLLQDVDCIERPGVEKVGVRSIVARLLPGQGAGEIILRANGVWTLFQRRHLIVHRRGVIDAEYIQSTGDALQLGSLLVVTADQLHEYMASAALFGQVVLDAAAGRFGK